MLLFVLVAIVVIGAFVCCGVDCVGLCVVAGVLWVVAGVIFCVVSLFCVLFYCVCCVCVWWRVAVVGSG